MELSQRPKEAGAQAKGHFAAMGGMDSGPVPAAPYSSEQFFALERENIFRRAWLFMGHESQIADHGDFIVRNVEICQASILISRGKDGKIRAFHNVCAHRGNLVEDRCAGNSPVFTCRYHGWSYRSDGRLLGVPDQAMFVSLDKSKCGLSTVHLDVWNGWMFINLSDPPELTLSEYLGDFAHFFEGVKYVNLDNPIVFETVLACNWKVVCDAFMEAYHIPSIHRTTIKNSFSNASNQYGRLLDARFFGPHRLVSMFGNIGEAPSADQPVTELAIGQSVFRPEAGEAMAEYLDHPAINPTKTANWSMDMSGLFPNVNIDYGNRGQFTHEYWPIAVDQSRHRATFYLPEPQNIRQRFQLEFTLVLVADVMLEDLGNVERTQRGLNSGAITAIQLSESEVAIRHSTTQVMKWANATSVVDAMGV